MISGWLIVINELGKNKRRSQVERHFRNGPMRNVGRQTNGLLVGRRQRCSAVRFGAFHWQDRRHANGRDVMWRNVTRTAADLQRHRKKRQYEQDDEEQAQPRDPLHYLNVWLIMQMTLGWVYHYLRGLACSRVLYKSERNRRQRRRFATAVQMWRHLVRQFASDWLPIYVSCFCHNVCVCASHAQQVLGRYSVLETLYLCVSIICRSGDLAPH